MFAASRKLSATISRRGMCSSVPVTQVATHFKINVRDEETAARFDEFVRKEAIPVTSSTAGFQRCVRTVCKTEWAYEIFFVWDNSANYHAWKESKKREDLVAKLPSFLAENKLEGLYAGVRVFDELS